MKENMLIKKIIAKLHYMRNLLEVQVFEANDIEQVKKHFGWSALPIFERPDIHEYEYIEDLNQRRHHDAELIATVMVNVKAKTVLEIGTSTGLMTLLMAKNSPESRIYTLNIPPEDIIHGKGGKNTTIALEKEKIGCEYRKHKVDNVVQIYANSSNWEPEIGTIDVAFIDGCHDKDYVYNDTKKIIKHMKKGGYIIWHDFNPKFRKKFYWINDVCKGIERLYRKKIITDKIIVLKDSWTGLYRVP